MNKINFDPSLFDTEVTALEVVAHSLITGIGMTSEKTAAAAKAGIDCLQESAILNSQFNGMKMVFLPEELLSPLDDKLNLKNARTQRMLRLITNPLLEICDQEKVQQPLVLMLALPESVPGVKTDFDDSMLALIEIQTGLKLNLEESKVFPFGRAGGLVAIHQAASYLKLNPTAQVLVGGVDTYLDLYYLASLDAEDRILAENKMDAFVPGEGAGFILLSNPTNGSTEKMVKIHPPGIGLEPGHRYNKDEPYKGDGLSEAFQKALLNSPDKCIDTIYCSLNGENFGAKEFGVAQIRNSEFFSEQLKVHHPAEYFGDIGAAFAPILIALASISMAQGQIQNNTLVWCSAEGAARAAVKLSYE